MMFWCGHWGDVCVLGGGVGGGRGAPWRVGREFGRV